MFNFMGKKEKKSRKGLSTSFANGNGNGEEIDNLEELRRSLKLKPGKRKEKVKLPSGITADYSSAFFAQLDSDKGKEQDREQDEVLLENSTTIQGSPAIPPRGILKNARTKYSSDTGQQISTSSANNSPDGSSIENFVNSLSSKYELTSEYTFQTSNGAECKENSNSVYDGQFPLPKISARPLLPVRTLTIKRSHEHGFGFSLRKVGIANRADTQMRYVIFAEPAKSDSGLVPGDRLLRVNGIAVENFSMEKIVEMIRNSGDKIIVEVQPIAELTELALRCNPADYPISRINMTFEENGKCGDEKVWLMHRAGYSQAQIINSNDSGKITISLDHSGEQLAVDEFSVSTKNPDDLDFAEDICQLKYLNEPSVLHCIRSRFTNNLIHTRAGPSLIVVNPAIHLPIYSDKIISALKSCKSENMPPHIYSLAQSSYREMLDSRRDQSLIFIGNSSSGKSTSFKHAIFYLTLMAGSNKVLNAEKINAVHTILDYFGNSQTTSNANATRFTQLFSINFDHIGQIVSASVQVILMDKSIIARRNKRSEASIDVISRLIVGVEGNLKKELLLDTITNVGSDNNLFVNIPSQLEERQKLSEEFKSLAQAFQTLSIDERMTKALWSILAAIYHLGSASVSRTNSRIQFENAVSAKRAANLLGVSVEKLHDMIFSSLGKNNSKLAASPIDGEDKELTTAMYILEGIVSALYNEVFTTIVSLINKSISTSSHSVASIILIDSPGLQIPTKNSLATLDDLKNNYLQERLQQLFHHVHLMMPHDRYSQEMIEISVERLSGFSSLVKLIDQSPRNNHVTKSPKQNENDKTSGLGIFCLLDDESSQFNSNDESFLQKLFTIFNDESSKVVLKKGPNRQQFYLHHFQATTPVIYSVKGWLKECQNSHFAKNAMNLLQESGRDEIITLINEGFKVGSYNTLKDGTQSLRRVSSIRRSFGSVSSKRNSSMLQIKLTVDGLIDTLRRTNTHFIHCFTSQSLEKSEDTFIDIPQLSSQVRGTLIIEAARLHRNGFPENIPIDEFVRRYGLLSSEVSKESITVETILKSNESEIDASAYRVGSTQIFFRSGVLNKLEAKLLESLTDRIIQLQAYCRGNLARKRVEKKKVQLLAVRCIQRNVRAFISIRDWPWWRLLVRVNPLLNVHRAEEKLKIACSELQTLKLKLEKVENDRNFLKQENQNLEGKLSEMTLELVEERSSSNLVNERLDVEHGERMKLEKELDQQKEKYFNLQDASEKLELELLCAKSDINSVSEEELEHDDVAGSAYRLKYERAVRELEYTRKRLQTQHEHDLEQLVGLKKQLEKKLADAFEEIDEQRKCVAQWKRKNQKMAGEMNDLRILLDEQNARNNVLEKKQKKFDSELQALQDVVKLEKQAKEKLSKENHAIMTEKYQIEQTLADTQNDLECNVDKVSALTNELNELTFHSNSEEEVAQLKRLRLDLDKKCKDQEEELDEQAAQIQLLEQAKLKLEMTLETMRKEIRRESQQQNEEIEDIRSTSYKKIKSLECQLEHEHEERTLLLREKHELERRLNLLEDQDRTERAAEEATIKKLKQDLRKCKALMRDSQAQLERARADSSGKVLIRQLRNQLEDADSAKVSAVRARQIAESELNELQTTLDEMQRAKHDSEEKVSSALRDLKELQTQLDENEEEMSELMRKYSLIVKQLSGEQAIVSDYQIRISDLESDITMLKQQNQDLTARLECFESSDNKNSNILNKRLEMRVKELESRLEFEQITKGRFETQVSRLRDNLEKSQHEISVIRSKEMVAQEGLKKSQKSLRDLREEFHSRLNREQEEITKRKDLEKRLELSAGESSSLKNDLRLALKRIADLQQALNDGDSEELDDDDGSDLSSDSDDIGDDITATMAK